MAEYPIEIIQAINNVMADAEYVQKQDKNEFHKYSYASEKSLLEVLRPAMVKHGLVLIPSNCDQSDPDGHGNTRVRMEYTLAHVSGKVWPERIFSIGIGNDRHKNGTVGDKGGYKAVTGANKYMLFKLFQLPSGDDPEKKSTHDEQSDQPPTPVNKAPPPLVIKSAGGMDLAAFPRDGKGVLEMCEKVKEILRELPNNEVQPFWAAQEDLLQDLLAKVQNDNVKSAIDGTISYAKSMIEAVSSTNRIEGGKDA